MFSIGYSTLASTLATAMSLASVLQTALSGMSAASVTVDVVSHNLANSRTAGFKAGRPVFATQTPATLRPGTAPGTSHGGGNPLQIGTGVRAVEIRTDFSQGPLVATSEPTDLSLENTVTDSEMISQSNRDSGGAAAMTPGTIELSNTNIGQNTIDLVLASNQFAMSAVVFRTADSLLGELTNLIRR